MCEGKLGSMIRGGNDLNIRAEFSVIGVRKLKFFVESFYQQHPRLQAQIDMRCQPNLVVNAGLLQYKSRARIQARNEHTNRDCIDHGRINFDELTFAFIYPRAKLKLRQNLGLSRLRLEVGPRLRVQHVSSAPVDRFFGKYLEVVGVSDFSFEFASLLAIFFFLYRGDLSLRPDFRSCASPAIC